MTDPYQCILADPPWNEYGGGKCKRGADRHYPLMKTKDIVALMRWLLCDEDGQTLLPSVDMRHEAGFPRMPVADNAHLWMWVTNNFLPDGLEVMKELGFRYVTNVAWAKMEQRVIVDRLNAGMDTCDPERPDTFHLPVETCWKKQRPGLGQYLAGQHELLLFGVRGRLPALWKDKSSGARRQGTLICAPRGEHSQKPAEAYDLIENVTTGPRLELFARGVARPGWDVWGNEADQ